MRDSLMCPSRFIPDQDDGVTKLQEGVLGLLEDAGIPTYINDRIVSLVEHGERQLAGEDEPSLSLEQALAVVFPYTDPADDDRVGRADAMRVIYRALGMRFAATVRS